MKVNLKLMYGCLVALLLLAPALIQAQGPTEVATEATEAEPDPDKPLDDIVEKRLIKERRVLPYQPMREADIFWEKRIWRVIDVREKMNKPFAYPEMPFIKILMDAATKGDITVYSVDDDKFTYALDPSEAAAMGASVDTVITFDPETYAEEIKIVRNDLNPDDIKRYRIKEAWFFDEETSTLQVRILGIAPLRDIYDDMGNLLYEQPMFWVYYPDAREILARQRAFNDKNDASVMTWEDIFEMRYFSSYIYKESNVYDRRLQDYLSGVDLLLEGEKIKDDIFNFEHDLWSY